PAAVCSLNEQSRMAEPICRVVSQTFYGGELVVAKKERASPDWNEQRRLRNVPGIGSEAVSIIHVPEDRAWSNQLGGPIRKWSADRIAEIVAALVHDATSDV